MYLGNGLISAMEVTIPLYLKETLEMEPWAIGLIYGMSPISYTIGIIAIGKFGKSQHRWLNIVGGLLGMGIGYFSQVEIVSCCGLLFFDHLAWFIFCWLLIGPGMGAIDVW